MTIAQQVTQLKQDFNEVKQAGKEIGFQEGFEIGNEAGAALQETAYKKGVTDGGQAEYDRFWDAYQNGGSRVDYTHGFGGRGWTNDIFKPRYDICPTSAYMMFRYSNITGDLVEILGSLGVKLDFSKCTNTQYCFYGTRITRLGVIDLSSCPNAVDAMFMSATAIKTIDLFRLAKNQQKLDSIFSDCSALENITFEGNVVNNISLGTSPKLSKDSIVSIINALDSQTAGKIATLSKTAVTKAFGSTAADEWTALIATKPSWTITLK